MTHRKRKLPTCATCGEPLRTSGRIVIEYPSRTLLGSPSIGAHMNCCDADPTFLSLIPGRTRDLTALAEAVERIGARGASRVSAGPRWWQAHPPSAQLPLLPGGR